MTNRNRRLESGIKSIEDQIRMHQEKIKKADGNDGLLEYYEKEIKGMKEQIERKKKMLEK
jgi:hypothetical protein